MADSSDGCLGRRNKKMEIKFAYEYSETVRTLFAEYTKMLLDTLPFLQSAIRMYRNFGFYEIESYNNSLMDTSIYMKLDLI